VRRFALPFLLITLGIPTIARAETPDEVRARALFDDAVAGRCPDACACYEQSLALVESTSAHLNLADCYEKKGQLATARGHWTRAIETLPVGDARRAGAEARLSALDARMPKMVFRFVVAPPQGTRVLVDGHDLGPAALRGASVLADPGRHVVSVETPGEPGRTFTLDLEPGSKKSIVIEPPTPAQAPLPVRSVPPPPPDKRRAAGAEALDVTGSILAGLGGGALLAAAITGVVIADNDDEIEVECPDKRCTTRGLDLIDENEHLLTANSILWGAAGIGLLAGGGLLIAAEAVKPGITGFNVVPLDHGAAFVVAGRLP
jgi:hypothetical protein